MTPRADDLRRLDRRATAVGAVLLVVVVAYLVASPALHPSWRLVALGVILVSAGTAALLRRRFWAALDAELERCKLAEQLARAAERTKGRFLANLSHEIRAPMQGILGMADLLLRSEPSRQQREATELIRTSAQALLSLAEDVLDLSRIDAGGLALRPCDFSLHSLVDGVLRLQEPRALRRGVDLRLDVEGDVPDTLYGDPVRLRQVLFNLVGNAVRFTRRGSVTVRVEATRDGSTAEGPVPLRFVVQDTGVGIRAEDQVRLFEPFIQVGSSASGILTGSGLGLVISKNLVELMGGEIGFESERGVGSTFWFQVPLEAARGEPADPTPDRTAGPGADLRRARRGRRVLVVDDRSVNRTVAVAMLTELGYTAEATTGGEEALEMLEARSFDALLLDCRMPGIDGFETCRRWRRREIAAGGGRHLPVIAITAHSRPEDTERCRGAGMDDHLGKPFHTAELAAAVDRLLGIDPTGPRGADEDADVGAEGDDEDGDGDLERRLEALERQDGERGGSTLGAFLRQGEDDMATVRAALPEADLGAVAEASHALAGSAGLLGAGDLAARASQVAVLARSGDPEGCAGRLPDLERAWRRLVERLSP